MNHISYQRVKELRDQTGIGINAWVEALRQTGGCEETALLYLKGQWKPPATKPLEDRIAKLESDVQYLISLIDGGCGK